MTMKTLAALTLAAATLAPLTAAAQEKGKALFDSRCAACHGANGAGIPGLAPTLGGALPYLDKPAGRDYVLGVLTHGLSGKIVSRGQTYMGAMPPQTDLSDEDIAAVVNHLGKLNGQQAAVAKAEDAAKLRATQLDHKALRDQRAALNP